jgi:hypothetical protein
MHKAFRHADMHTTRARNLQGNAYRLRDSLTGEHPRQTQYNNVDLRNTVLTLNKNGRAQAQAKG